MMQLIQISLFDLRISQAVHIILRFLVFIKGKERPEASSVVVAL